jgi:hypothetical protein
MGFAFEGVGQVKVAISQVDWLIRQVNKKIWQIERSVWQVRGIAYYKISPTFGIYRYF